MSLQVCTASHYLKQPGAKEPKNGFHSDVFSRVDKLFSNAAKFEAECRGRVALLEKGLGAATSNYEPIFKAQPLQWKNFKEILERSLEYLDINDVSSASRVCRKWNEVAFSERFCKSQMIEKFPVEYALISSLYLPNVRWTIQLKQAVIQKRTITTVNRVDEKLQRKEITCDLMLTLTPIVITIVDIFF